ncbi:glucocorticoid receptor-like (DNA-binding domain) [Lichtheimia hyalospora FSU 10163]|nr:glucocorticoid receptor-like (DNA-binding domain) [Lichtheimia hyalospora FSU 10163]
MSTPIDYVHADKMSLLQHQLPSPSEDCTQTFNFPSPTSSNSSSIDSGSPNTSMFFDPNAFQNLPISVLQSITALYQPGTEELTHSPVVTQPMSTTPYFDDMAMMVPATPPLLPPSSTGISITPSTFESTPPPLPSSNTTVAATPNISTHQQQEKPKNSRTPRQLECYNCHVTKTPLWRRTPDRAHSLCNACGLYYKQYGNHRPLHIRQKQSSSSTATSTTGSKKRSHADVQNANMHKKQDDTDFGLLQKFLQQENQQCVNCYQTTTPLWRKNELGESVCNACGLYQKHHNKSRPMDVMQQQQQQQCKRRRPLLPSEDDDNSDSRFRELLDRMNPEQMQSFLIILERRCALLKSMLSGDEQLAQRQQPLTPASSLASSPHHQPSSC